MKILHRAIAAAAVLTFSLASPAAAQDPSPEGDRMKPSGAVQVVMDDDAREFFETAASANHFEIESSKLALERATDPTLKTFARKMVRDHERAAEEFKALARRKDMIVPTSMLERHEAMLNDLRDEAPGRDFDDEYRDKMVSSHKEAVSLFDETARDAADPEIKAFAAMTLPTLQAHGGAAKALPKPRG